MLRDFIAIDFETANQEPSSVCSVGVIMVREGQIVDSFYSLIQPEPNYYNHAQGDRNLVHTFRLQS